MATITWQNVNATPSYSGVALLNKSTDLANLSFSQLGSALDRGAELIGDHVDKKLQEELFSVQQSQKQAAQNIRKSIYDLESLHGISDVDSLSGKVTFATPEQILKKYNGDPGDEAGIKAFVASEQEKAALAAKQFMDTDFGLLSSEEYDSWITNTATSIGKKPEEIKALQEAYKLDLNKGHGLTQSDEMELAATKARADMLAAMNQKEYEMRKKEKTDAITAFENDIQPYKDQTVDQFAYSHFAGQKDWNNNQINELVRNVNGVGAEVAAELAANPAYENLLIGGKKNKDGTWVVPPRLSDDILNMALGTLPVGEDGALGFGLDFLRFNKQINGSQKEQVKQRILTVAKQYQGYYDKLADATKLDQQYLLSQTNNSILSMNTLADLEQRMKNDASVIDGDLWNKYREKR